MASTFIARLATAMEDILDITPQIDPEDDTEQKPTQGLPGHEQMLKQLNRSTIKGQRRGRHLEDFVEQLLI